MRGISLSYPLVCFLTLAPNADATGKLPPSTSPQGQVNPPAKTKICNAIQSPRTGVPSLFQQPSKNQAQLDAFCAQIYEFRTMGVNPNNKADPNTPAAKRQRQACEQAASKQGTHCVAIDLERFDTLFCNTPQNAQLASATPTVDLEVPYHQSTIPASAPPASALQSRPAMSAASLTRRGIGKAFDLLWTYTGIVFLSAVSLALAAAVTAAGAVIMTPGLVFYIVVDFGVNFFRITRQMCQNLGQKMSNRHW